MNLAEARYINNKFCLDSILSLITEVKADVKNSNCSKEKAFHKTRIGATFPLSRKKNYFKYYVGIRSSPNKCLFLIIVNNKELNKNIILSGVIN